MIYSVGGPSGGKLAYLLGCSVKHPRGNTKRDIAWERDTNRDLKLPVEINYGCEKKYLTEGCINYRSEEVQDKLHCFGIFDEAKIPHPRIITEPEKEESCFLGRKNKSSQGNGIVKYTPEKDTWKKGGSDFFVEFVDVDKEFRVHVVMGQIVCEFNKEFGNGHSFIHSKQFGSRLRFGYLDHPNRRDILDASIMAVFKTGLQYGAVDVISEKGTNRWLILEVNSAPSLAHEIGYCYAEKFAHILGIGINKWWQTTGTGQIIDNRKVLETCKFKTAEEKIAEEKPSPKKRFSYSR